MPPVAIRARAARRCIAAVGVFLLGGCRDGDRSAMLADPPPAGDCDLGGVTGADRLRAMLVVQTVVLTWGPGTSQRDPVLAPPAAAEVERALDIIRCDQGRRAASRRTRAIAKLIGNDPTLARATPHLQRLGFTDAAAIGALKDRALAQYPPAVRLLYRRDPRWLEFAVLRYLTTTKDPTARQAAARSARWFGPAPAHAQAQAAASCWQPEAPSTYDYVHPYAELTAHVSVEIDPSLPDHAAQQRVQGHVDPQQWNDCSEFWSPPDPADPSAVLDGARFVEPEWVAAGTCTPTEPFKPDAAAPTPGQPYGQTHYLFEYFFVPGPVKTAPPMDAWFQNILAIFAESTTRRLLNGTTVPAHRIDYWLGTCVIDKVDGAMGGEVLYSPIKTILDAGEIEVWTEGTRTHVSATKTVEFPGVTWITQLNPALHELNEQLGELACCL